MWFSWLKKTPVYQMQLNGNNIPVREGQSLLQAALEHNIHLQSGCKVGNCGLCKCRLLAGRVQPVPNADNAALDATERQSGLILACQNTAQSNLRLEVAETKRQKRNKAEQLA
ncbi:2Fe-2S iron-sulfur cluster-binding protein [Rheinheimera sp. 4Y26]|uniref:2Fe-2S iron-sulfur cluster-binding protein n=1 Tax=Rheinheimera sp. 4Y26 TaxID=2977811 RepID=UPI0021B09BFE|nr:2Fe-2S iron-sulfur cluster-binding protein [Rheinheimera sp. 4Y26]MCT6700063.1 2Fe-2S iron-sulfur cluster-binding protein [Rheinheimera sp. 4Y26]